MLRRGPYARAAGIAAGRSVGQPRGQLDTLQGKELALDLEELLPAAEPVAAVATDRAIAGDHAMARNRQPDRVPPDGAANRPSGTRPADHPRQAAVARHFSAAQPPNSEEHRTVPGPMVGEVERQVIECRRVAFKKPLDCGDGAVENARRTRPMLQSGAPPGVREEWREGRKNGD